MKTLKEIKASGKVFDLRHLDMAEDRSRTPEIAIKIEISGIRDMEV